MESLSDYMMLEVFVRLDPASLKTCTEVCKRWNKLITESVSAMDILTLKVNRLSKLRDLRGINRRYSNVKLNGMTISPKAWSLLNCQQNLRKLELNRIKINESNNVKMLQSIPTLQEFTIVECTMTASARGAEIVKLPMLQKLTTSGCTRLLKNIDLSELKKFEFTDSFICGDRSRFISSMQKLEDLSLNMYGIQENERYVAPEVQLKKLKLSFKLFWSCSRMTGCSLVKTHAATLETLEIKAYHRPEETTDYDLTNVAPFNSLSTQSFEEFYKLLVDVYSTSYSQELIASTAKYYIPQLKSMKIRRPRPA